MTQRIALVTNCLAYAGPAATGALSADGFVTMCHDASFTDAVARAAFTAQHPKLVALAAQDSAAIFAEAASHGAVEAIVSNDYVPPSALGASLETASLESVQHLLDELFLRPFLLIQAALPALKAARKGSIVLMTSAAAVKLLAVVPLYSAIRAAATTLATVCAKTLGEHNILVNSIGPNWFENPTYFPPGRWEQDAALRETVAKEVPLQRLGKQEEMGALIAFLASGKAAPVTGQFFGFTGGWLP